MSGNRASVDQLGGSRYNTKRKRESLSLDDSGDKENVVTNSNEKKRRKTTVDRVKSTTKVVNGSDAVVNERWRRDTVGEQRAYRVPNETDGETGWENVSRECRVQNLDEIINLRLLPEPTVGPDDVHKVDTAMYRVICKTFDRYQREYQQEAKRRAVSSWKDALEFNQNYTKSYLEEMRTIWELNGERYKTYAVTQGDTEENKVNPNLGSDSCCDSFLNSESYSYSYSWNDSQGYKIGNESGIVQTVVPIKYEKPIRIPHFKTWSPVPFNIFVEEEKTLTNLPYGFTNNDSWDTNLADYLFQSYRKVPQWKKSVVPLKIIFRFIQCMYEKEEKLYRNRQYRLSSSDNDMEKQRRRILEMPSSNVMKLITIRLHKMISHVDLEESYVADVTKKRKNDEVFQIKTNSTFVARKEGPNAHLIEAEKLTASYAKSLCNRCNVFSCLRHDKNDHGTVMHNYPVVQEADTDDSENWDHCDKKQCILTGNTQSGMSRSPKIIQKEWSVPQINQFRLLHDIFHTDYCAIACGIKSKNCYEVREFAAIVKNKRYPGKNSAQLGKERNPKGPTKRRCEKLNTELKAQRLVGSLVANSNDDIPLRPCQHPNNEKCSKNCSCFLRKVPCEKFCQCSVNCANRFPGCLCDGDCRAESTKCPCYAAKRECDPDLCRNCKITKKNGFVTGGETKYECCNNVPMQIGAELPVAIRPSFIPDGGWGAFALQDIKRDTFVMEYRGELIGPVDFSRRSSLYHKQNHTYMYSIDKDCTIDGTKSGNCIRFANSSATPNIEGRRFFVQGDYRIAIFTVDDVSAGEELTLNYEYLREETSMFSKGVYPY